MTTTIDIDDHVTEVEKALMARNIRTFQTLTSNDRSKRPSHRKKQWLMRKRRRVFARDYYTCWLCGRHATELAEDEFLTLDHVVPRSKGGPSSDENLKTACRACNVRRGNSEQGPQKPQAASESYG